MAEFGYTLYCEGFSPQNLVEQAIMAEAAGFDFLAISDHFHPWLLNQSHAGFAWSILGAIANATSRIKLATMVTCPIVRYHPSIVAQMAATIGVLSNGRFTLGIGTGERLNEHIVGKGWFAPKTRQAMLAEAIDIIAGLWKGDYFSYAGSHFSVEDAKIFDLPGRPLQTFCAAGGPLAARLAAEKCDGLCITEPSKDTIKAYTKAGGDSSKIWAQTVLSWDPDMETAQQTAYEQFRFSAGGWPVQAEIPNPAGFDAATKFVKPAMLTDSIACGPDPLTHAKNITQYVQAGVTKLALVYPGQDTKGFMEFWNSGVKPLVAS